MTPIYNPEQRNDYIELLRIVINDIVENDRIYEDKHMYLCVSGLKVFPPNSLNYRQYEFFIQRNQHYFCSWYLSKGYDIKALRPCANGGDTTFLRTTEISNYKTINNIRFIYLNHLYDLLNMEL